MDNQLITNDDDKGKEVSKFNASKHGVLRKTLLEFEEEQATQLNDELVTELKPEGRLELLLVEKIVIARIRYERAVMIEKQQVDSMANPPRYKTEYEEGAYIPPREQSQKLLNPISWQVHVGGAPEPMVSFYQMTALEKTFMRYITACERQFYRALHELQRIQSIRKGIKPTSVAVDFLNDNREE